MSGITGALIVGGTALAGSAIGAVATNKQTKSANRAAGQARAAVNAAAAPVQDFQFSNVYEGITDQFAGYDPTTVNASQTAAFGYDAAQAQVGQLGQARGYQATQAQAAQLGPAGQVSLRNLASGADFLSNPFANLQVGTAAADLQGRQTDRALAQTLESGAITGGGGATALAAQAAESKAGISANIQQQELQNAQLRARGQQQLEQGLLQQSNLQNQFGFEQDRFNVGERNQFAVQRAGFQQSANLANAQAANQAAQFGAQAGNQFALERFGAGNQFALSNQAAQNAALGFSASAQNQAAAQNAQLAQQANIYNADAYTRADQYQTDQYNRGLLLEAEGADVQQQRDYARYVDLLNAAGGQAASASQAQATARAAQAQAISGGFSSGLQAGTSIVTAPGFGG